MKLRGRKSVTKWLHPRQYLYDIQIHCFNTFIVETELRYTTDILPSCLNFLTFRTIVVISKEL